MGDSDSSDMPFLATGASDSNHASRAEEQLVESASVGASSSRLSTDVGWCGNSEASELSGNASTTRQTCVLLHKNSLMKRREWWSTACCPFCPLALCCEIILPLLVVFLLWWAHSMCSSGTQCQIPILAGWGGLMPRDNITTVCTEGLEINDYRKSYCSAWTDKFQRPIPFIDILIYLHCSNKKLALAVKDPSDAQKVASIRKWITENWYPKQHFSKMICWPLEGQASGIFPLLTDEELPDFTNLTSIRGPKGAEALTKNDLDAYLDSPLYGEEGNDAIFAAIVFDKIGGNGRLGAAGDWSYSIRLNVSSGTSVNTITPKTHLQEGQGEEAAAYLSRGFAAIQLTLDRYIIGSAEPNTNHNQLFEKNGLDSKGDNDTTMAEPLRYAPQAVEAVPFPVEGTIIDGFYKLIAPQFSLLFILAFMYTQKKVMNELIIEKETKLRESLRMMGVPSLAIIGSWYATYGLLFALLCSIFTIVCSCNVFPNSNPFFLFLFFWMWCMNCLSFAFCVHCFFNNARVGGVVGMALNFVQWIVYAAASKHGTMPSGGMLFTVLLLPNGAFSVGLTLAASLEETHIGVRWSTLDWRIESSSFIAVLGMQVLSTILWTCFGWYLDLVLPKEFGVRFPWYFLCSSEYWRGRHISDQGETPGDALPQESDSEPEDLERVGVPAVCAGMNACESVPEGLRMRSLNSKVYVSVHSLSKTFSTPGGPKVAVSDLQLTMYQGQVLALLGHNGAGKTTTVNMLTGMVAPTSGDAFVGSLSVQRHIAQIRKIIGVCPQHDILWFDLTVAEHLDIFGRLRGLPNVETKNLAQKLMQDVGVGEKARTRASALSGGQKRKLSLCIALLGNPRVIFLDEPTSGMDPYSRRSTWDLIRGNRDGRVTVLTTHFMDEAEILGDRIAIMADGVLQCCGSSLFLKARFGAGYRITCSRRRPHLAGHNALCEIVNVILKHVTAAELASDIGAEMSMRLPMTAASSFPALFSELDANAENIGLEHYGLSMVTLEEVFLRVASGDMASLDELPCVRGQSQLTEVPRTITDLTFSSPARVRGQSQLTEVPRPITDLTFSSPASRSSSSETTSNSQQPEADTPNFEQVRLVAAHTGTLFRKRFRYGRRDFGALVCLVLLPVATISLGLWLLLRVSSRHWPVMPLGVVDQFGEGVDVPFNSTNLPWFDDPLTQRFEPRNLPPEPGYANKYLFGRAYQSGLPVGKICRNATKCTAQASLCNKDLENIVSRNHFICGITRDNCDYFMNQLCTNDAKICTDACMRTEPSKEVCWVACNKFCMMHNRSYEICQTFQDGGVADLCPISCGNWDSTCVPGSSCTQSESHPISTLNFAMLSLREGGGRTRKTAQYGSLLASHTPGVGGILTLFYNKTGIHAVPSYLNAATSAIKKRSPLGAGSISVTNDPLPRTKTEPLEVVISGVVELSATFVIIIAFSFIPAGITAYIVREREEPHNSKHQQLISGVGVVSYWASNFLWDLCMYAVTLTCSLVCLFLFDIRVFTAGNAALPTIVVFIAYGLAIVPFSYIISFAFEKHTTAQVVSLVFNFMSGLLLTIVSEILSAIDATKSVNESLKTIYRCFPGFCLGNGLLQIYKKSFVSSLVHVDATDLLSAEVAGIDVLYMFCASPFYMILVLTFDYVATHSQWRVMSLLRFLQRRRSADAGGIFVDGVDVDDVDVAAERARVVDSSNSDDFRILELRKVYNAAGSAPKVAVHGLSFGLPRGECFGFLGINGAGKTSTLKMITGAVLPTAGTAKIAGLDIITEQWLVRQHLGYCPQHDALLDRLTVRDHLELYGRIKRIPRRNLRDYCDAMLNNLSLLPHVDKMAMQLSGGNKRKLSLAISLMGAPRLALLDEPSTGVDPAARRMMWNVISAASTAMRQGSVMLTTHNMEEAEALCSRVGIMVGGRLRCIGSNQHIKARFGTGYQVEVRIATPSEQDISDVIKNWRAPSEITVAEVSSLCDRLGCPGRMQSLNFGDQESRSVLKILQKDGRIPAQIFAQWYLLEDRVDAVKSYMQRVFGASSPLEWHGRKMRYKLPPTNALSDLFRQFEGVRAELSLEDYGISQTTLEQIFNNFAAKDEYLGQVRIDQAVLDQEPSETAQAAIVGHVV